MAKLRPCPFCGREPDVSRHSGVYGQTAYVVECTNFKCEMVCRTKQHFTEERAIEVWNKRVRYGE